MRRCLIITGGKLDLAFARSFLEKETFDKIIAVDGGLKAVKELGLVPDYIVGDFDSVSYGKNSASTRLLYGSSISRRRMRQTQSLQETGL